MVKKIKKIFEAAEKRVYGKDIPDDRNVVEQEGKLIIQKTTKAEADAMSETFNKIFAEDTTIDGRQVLQNLDAMDIPTDEIGSYLNAIKNKNANLFNFLKRGKIKTSDMIQYARELGEVNTIRLLLKLKPGELTKAENLFAGMLVVHKNLRKIEKNYKKIRELPNTSSKEIKDLDEEIQFLSSINKNVGLNIKAVKSEMARGLRDPFGKEVIENVVFQEIPRQSDNIPMIKQRAKTFLAIPTNKKSRFIDQKGPFAKANDVLQEIYINALLSSPATHMVNFASNLAFQFKTLADTGVAGLVGTVRTGTKKLTGQEFDEFDRVFVGEAAAELVGGFASQLDALTLMSKTFLDGQAPDLLTKTELEDLNAIGKHRNLSDIMKQFKEGDVTGGALSVIGSYNGLPGRFLASGDEYYKVISRKRFIYKEAYKDAMKAYQITRKADGSTSQDAIDQFVETFMDAMENPSEGTIEGAKQFSKRMTFQQELGNSIPEIGVKKLMGISPFMRYIIPFVKTPTNVIKEALGSTLNAANPKFYVQLKNASGREFDQLVGKLLVGNSIAATMVAASSGFFGDDIRITGAGPSAKGAKKYWQGAGIPRYSIGVKQDDGSYEWTSFSRFDPISGILAMSADLAYYMQNESDPSVIQGLVNSLTTSITSYAGQLPFLQGVSEISRLFSDFSSDPKRSLETLGKFFGQKAGDVASTVGRVGGPASGMVFDYLNEYTDVFPVSSSSFTATLERVGDPQLSETYKLDDLQQIRELPSWMRGYYIALQRAKSRNPRFSSGLSPKLNFWGEELTQTEGRWDEYFNPIKRTMSRQETPLELELIDLANKTGRAFSKHPSVFLSGKERVELSAPLYNTYVGLINEVDDRGNIYGEPNYNISTSLIPKLEDTISGKGKLGKRYFKIIDPEEKFDLLNTIVANKRKAAKGKLYEGTDSETQKLNFYLGRE